MPRRGEPVSIAEKLENRLSRCRGLLLDANAFKAVAKAFVDHVCRVPTDNVVYALVLELKRMMGSRFVLHSYDQLRKEYDRRLNDLAQGRLERAAPGCPLWECRPDPRLEPVVKGLCHLFNRHEKVDAKKVLSRSERLEELYQGLRREGYSGLPGSLEDFKHDFKKGRAGDKHVDAMNIMLATIEGPVLVTSDRGIMNVFTKLKPGYDCLCIYFSHKYIENPVQQEIEFALAPKQSNLPGTLRYLRGPGRFAR